MHNWPKLQWVGATGSSRPGHAQGQTFRIVPIRLYPDRGFAAAFVVRYATDNYGKTPTFVAMDLGMSLYNEALKLSKTEAQRFLQAKAMDSITIWEKRA